MTAVQSHRKASTAFALVTEVSKMLTSLRSRLKEDGT